MTLSMSRSWGSMVVQFAGSLFQAPEREAQGGAGEAGGHHLFIM